MKKVYFMKLGLLGLLLFATLLANAQTGSISGRVLDESKQTLPGASVSVKGTNKSTSTDANGNFKLTGIENGTAVIVVRFVGYQSVERTVNVSGDVRVDFSLQVSAESLGEVVVVGYGTQKKSDLTGSITSVSSKDFTKGQSTTPEQLIAGKVAGVQITSNNGAPGSGSTIRIRGGASLSASNDPLIVIDNVPLSNSSISGAANALALINPNDIESFNILKDASSTAIYGSRASNGVIIITTKKGTSGAPKYNFSSQNTISQVGKLVDVLNGDQLREIVNSVGTSSQKALLGTDNTNWQNIIYQSAVSSDNNFGVSGTYKNTPYRVSIGYLNQDGVLRTDNLQRTSASLSLSPKFFDNSLKIDLNLRGSLNKTRFANRDAIGSAVYFDPTKPVYSGTTDFGGYWEWLDPSSITGLAGLSPKNPLGLLTQKFDNGTSKRSIGNVELDYTFPFLKDLRAHANFGYDISRGNGTVLIGEDAAASYKRYKDASNVYHGGADNSYKQERTDLLAEYYLNYTKDLKSIDSRIDLLAGYAYQDFKTKSFNAEDRTYDGTVTYTPNFAFDIPQNRLVSFYGRLNYAFKGRYLLTAAIRRDGSSRFSPTNRFATFPSGALAWKISDESFLKNNKVVSDLKLRLGYGVTGQQDGIGNYDYYSYYNLSGEASQYQFGSTFYNMYAPGGYYSNRKWEQTETFNAALDFGFLDNRINGSVDVYLKKTSDLLNSIGQSAGSNFSNQVIANVGNMENRGVEINVNAEAIRSTNFTWDLGVNATFNKNEITKLNLIPDPNNPGNRFGGIAGGTGNNIMINSVGYNRGSFYVYQQVYDANNKPIEGLLVDRNQDGTINDKDLYQYQSADPKVFLGLTSNFTYKKWNAGFVMRASIGNYVYNNNFSNNGTYKSVSSLSTYLGNASANYLETGFAGTNVNQLLSDYYVQNASFLKVDNINLGYNVGKVLNNKASLRVNASVQNVLTITKYKGLDPEIGGGIDNNFYPRPRVFAFGLNLDF